VTSCAVIPALIDQPTTRREMLHHSDRGSQYSSEQFQRLMTNGPQARQTLLRRAICLSDHHR
jgi:hypothetical protein